MIHQEIKNICFGLARYAARPNVWLGRWRYRKPPAGGYRLHLGCGVYYKEGMINIDGNLFRKIDSWLDLRNPLPFPTGSASLVYCSHTLEHLFADDAIALLKEIYRVLREDGVARIVVPSMEEALRVARGESTKVFPRKFEDPMAQAVNYLFCEGQHKYGYSFSVMEDFAKQAGFRRIEDISARHGVEPREYGGLMLGDEPVGSLVVELRR